MTRQERKDLKDFIQRWRLEDYNFGTTTYRMRAYDNKPYTLMVWHKNTDLIREYIHPLHTLSSINRWAHKLKCFKLYSPDGRGIYFESFKALLEYHLSTHLTEKLAGI